MHKSRFALLAGILLAGAAPILAQPAADASAAQAAARIRYGTWGVDLTARDPAFRPGDDFYRHANNSWFKANPIPADRTGWSVWTVLDEEIDRQLRAIAEEGGSDPVS